MDDEPIAPKRARVRVVFESGSFDGLSGDDLVAAWTSPDWNAQDGFVEATYGTDWCVRAFDYVGSQGWIVHSPDKTLTLFRGSVQENKLGMAWTTDPLRAEVFAWGRINDRYYDPFTDQFLSVDPDVAETGQPYAFTADDPLNSTDPLGMMGTCGGQTGSCVQSGTAGHPETVSAPAGSAAPTSVYLDQPTPTVVISSGGGFQTTVSGDVQFVGKNTKSVSGITPNGTIETQVGPLN